MTRSNDNLVTDVSSMLNLIASPLHRYFRHTPKRLSSGCGGRIGFAHSLWIPGSFQAPRLFHSFETLSKTTEKVHRVLMDACHIAAATMDCASKQLGSNVHGKS